MAQSNCCSPGFASHDWRVISRRSRFARIRRIAYGAGAGEMVAALAISVAMRCDACVAFHAEAAVKRGATREEIMETMGMAIYMGAGPSVMYAAQAVEAYDQFRGIANSTAAA